MSNQLKMKSPNPSRKDDFFRRTEQWVTDPFRIPEEYVTEFRHRLNEAYIETTDVVRGLEQMGNLDLEALSPHAGALRRAAAYLALAVLASRGTSVLQGYKDRPRAERTNNEVRDVINFLGVNASDVCICAFRRSKDHLKIVPALRWNDLLNIYSITSPLCHALPDEDDTGRIPKKPQAEYLRWAKKILKTLRKHCIKLPHYRFLGEYVEHQGRPSWRFTSLGKQVCKTTVEDVDIPKLEGAIAYWERHSKRIYMGVTLKDGTRRLAWFLPEKLNGDGMTGRLIFPDEIKEPTVLWKSNEKPQGEI